MSVGWHPASRKVASKKVASKKATPANGADKPKLETPAANGKPASKRRLRFKRNDVVRFRKRSQIAKGLGVRLDTEYTVEMEATHEGRPVVVLRFGQGKHSALMKVPPGHLALVRRHEPIPTEIRACAARLSRYKGPISATTRRLMAELARRS